MIYATYESRSQTYSKILMLSISNQRAFLGSAKKVIIIIGHRVKLRGWGGAGRRGAGSSTQLSLFKMHNFFDLSESFYYTLLPVQSILRDS
jgi:hypothetical protein